MRSKLLQFAVLSLCAFAAVAAGPREVRKQIETSMLVTGTIDIAPDGSVDGYRLDQPDELSEFVVELIDKAVPGWRFEPVLVDGKVVKARSKMGLRIVATRLGDDRYQIEIRSAGFGDYAGFGKSGGRTVSSLELDTPSYPWMALDSGVSGTVYLVLRIGRDGSVEDVIAEQTNLTVVGNERQMRMGREMLEKAALAAARDWTFRPPTAGDAVDDPFWSVRVPVDFVLDDERNAKYGAWQAYIPGPRQTAPWLEDEGSAPDALVAGGVYQVGEGPRLLTALGEG